jgi:hypothetical protein
VQRSKWPEQANPLRLSVAVRVSTVGAFPDLTVNNKTKPTSAPMSEMGSMNGLGALKMRCPLFSSKNRRVSDVVPRWAFCIQFPLCAHKSGPPVRGERGLEMRPPPTLHTGAVRSRHQNRQRRLPDQRKQRRSRSSWIPAGRRDSIYRRFGFGRGGGDENFIPKDKGQPKPNERPQVEFPAVPRRYRREIGASTVAVSGGKLPFDRRTDRPAQGQ